MGRMLHLQDVPETATSAGRWQPLNTLLGVSTFGVNAVSIEPGEEIDIEHDEVGSQHQEIYVVVTGRAGFRVGANEFEAAPGDVVAAGNPAETRSYWALEPDTRIVCFGAGPGAEHGYGDWIAEESDG